MIKLPLESPSVLLLCIQWMVLVAVQLAKLEAAIQHCRRRHVHFYKRYCIHKVQPVSNILLYLLALSVNSRMGELQIVSIVGGWEKRQHPQSFPGSTYHTFTWPLEICGI